MPASGRPSGPSGRARPSWKRNDGGSRSPPSPDRSAPSTHALPSNLPLSPGPPAGWLAFLQSRAMECQGHGQVSGHPVPVCETPQVRVPAGEIVAFEAVGDARDVVAPDEQVTDNVCGEDVVHPDESRDMIDSI